MSNPRTQRHALLREIQDLAKEIHTLGIETAAGSHAFMEHVNINELDTIRERLNNIASELHYRMESYR